MKPGAITTAIAALLTAAGASPYQQTLFAIQNPPLQTTANFTRVPIVLPIPGSIAIAKGEVTITVFSNGSIVIGSLISVPKILQAPNGLNFRLSTANDRLGSPKVNRGQLVGKALQNVPTDITNDIRIDIKGH